MTYRFKVGDEVQFKSWEEMKKEYGVDCFANIATPSSFVTDMKPYCGKVCKIIKVCDYDSFQRLLIIGVDTSYNLDNYMFKLVHINSSFLTFKERELK